MRSTLISSLVFLAASTLAFASGCGKDATASATGESKTETAGDKATGNKAAGDGAVDVDLAPLPLTIRVPKGGMGAMDMSLGDKHSVTVDIGQGASLNVQPLGEGGVAALKQSYEKDSILHPFKRFVSKSNKRFVVEFEHEGKNGFIGVAVQQVGGKDYVCKTTGLDGVKSAELAEKHLSFCERLKAK